MIKWIRGLSRSKKLAIYGAAVLVILLVHWGMLGFPPLTKEMKFRRLMAERGFPGKSPELTLELVLEPELTLDDTCQAGTYRALFRLRKGDKGKGGKGGKGRGGMLKRTKKED